MKKIRILIAGIGGVGGYFGGLLANKFYESDEIEIFFLARGENLREIQLNGLKIVKGNQEFIAKPKLVTDTAFDIGIVDFIIFCTKSYDIDKVIKQTISCINDKTIILPLLNGVNISQLIRNHLPNNLVLEGTVYLVSKLVQAGKVENNGNIEVLYFGVDNYEDNRLNLLERIFEQANIKSVLSNKISVIVWEKFILVSSSATLTTYFDDTIGNILINKNKFEMLIKLIEEVSQIALFKQIAISKNIVEETINKLYLFPSDAIASMHIDFKKEKQNTELEILTGYVVSEGKKCGIKTPIFDEIYTYLLTKFKLNKIKNT